MIMNTLIPGSTVPSSIMFLETPMATRSLVSSPLPQHRLFPDDTAVPDDIVSPVPSRSVLAPSVALASPVATQCPMTPPPMSASSASSASSSATESSSSSLSSSRAHYDFRHDRSRAPLPAHENDFNLVDMTPPPRPIPVIAPEVDSDLSDDEYNVQSDSHIITDILLKNQLIIKEDNTTLTPHMINYFTAAIERFHVERLHGIYQETNLSRYKVFTNYTDTPGYNRVDIALFGWSPSYPLVNYGGVNLHSAKAHLPSLTLLQVLVAFSSKQTEQRPLLKYH